MSSTTYVLRGSRGAMRQPTLVLVVLAGMALVVVMIGGQILGASRPSTAERRGEERHYEDAVAGPAREGGFVVQEGLKVGLAQVATNQAANVTFQAIGWVDQLKGVRARIAHAARGVRDDRLRAAAKAFDEAIVLYETTAEKLGAAAIASGEPRLKLLTDASATGRRADARYDSASAMVQSVRRSLGLPPTARFPDPHR